MQKPCARGTARCRERRQRRKNVEESSQAGKPSSEKLPETVVPVTDYGEHPVSRVEEPDTS